MKSEEWKLIAPYFTPEECGEQMNLDFMLDIRTVRIAHGHPWIVLAGYATSGHAPNSYHYKGRALDFWTTTSPRYTLSVFDHFNLGGVGIYYWGSHYDKYKIPWFHVDDRPIKRYQRWISRKPGDYLYFLKD